MKLFIKNNWINILGLTMIFSAILIFLFSNPEELESSRKLKTKIILFTYLIYVILAVRYFRNHSKKNKLRVPILISFIIISVYWSVKAWVLKKEILSELTGLPFINLPSLTWISLATLGFTISNRLVKTNNYNIQTKTTGDRVVSLVSSSTALISHLLIFQLLYIQINYLWDLYQIENVPLNLVFSSFCISYALLLLVISKAKKEKLFRIFGTIVLLISALKIFLFDLHTASNSEKVIFLLLLGVLTCIVARLFKRIPEGKSKITVPKLNKHISRKPNDSTTFWKKF